MKKQKSYMEVTMYTQGASAFSASPDNLLHLYSLYHPRQQDQSLLFLLSLLNMKITTMTFLMIHFHSMNSK